MIKSFKHKGLEAFFESANYAGINPAHASKLKHQLAQLNQATQAIHMKIPGWNLHLLSGTVAGGQFGSMATGNWRLTFAFEGKNAILVNYQDYH